MRGIRVLGAIWCLLAVGCYSTVAVRPDELVKLNGSYDNSTSGYCSPGTSTVGPSGIVYTHPGVCTPGNVDMSVRQLIAPDGRAVEVKGEVNAIIHTQAVTDEFEHPVIVQRSGYDLTVRGSNGARTYAINDILAAEVKQKDPAKTALATTSVGVVCGLIMLAILIPLAD